MLHNPRSRRPRRRGRFDPRLSITLDTLPVSIDYILRRVHRATHPAHYLIIAREGATYGELGSAYARGPAWMRQRMFPPMGVTDPAVDLAAYHRTRWWHLEWQIGLTSVHLLEDAAPGITPWPHAWLN